VGGPIGAAAGGVILGRLGEAVGGIFKGDKDKKKKKEQAEQKDQAPTQQGCDVEPQPGQ
jgi:phage tail tape-measure protein